VNASAAMKNQVSDLLARAETLEHKKLALDKQAMEESMNQSTMEQSHTSGESLGMQTKSAQDIDNVEHAVESQLQKDHAPAQLISEEKILLENASALAHQAASLQTDLQSKRAEEKKKLASIHSGAFVKSGSQSARGALQGFANQMASIVEDDRSEIEEAKRVHNQAMKALSKLNASADTKNEVSDLLVRLETLKNNELILDHKAMKESITESIGEEMVHPGHKVLNVLHNLEGKVHSTLRNSSINASIQKKVDGLLGSVENIEQNVMGSSAESLHASHKDSSVDSQTDSVGQASLVRLEDAHFNLLRENAALTKEHAKLLQEKSLMKQNSALTAENLELSLENQHLRQELGVSA